MRRCVIMRRFSRKGKREEGQRRKILPQMDADRRRLQAEAAFGFDQRSSA
jgi:hypothetical protein